VNAGLPILRLGDILLSGLPSDLDDTTALAFTDELTTRIANEGIRGVIVDISQLEIIDSFVARVLIQLAETGRLLGAGMIVAGMRPAVALTLTELGLQLTGVTTALNAEQAMELLGWHRPKAAEEAPHAP
jgi:rsbT antagonist protein RsbS